MNWSIFQHIRSKRGTAWLWNVHFVFYCEISSSVKCPTTTETRYVPRLVIYPSIRPFEETCSHLRYVSSTPLCCCGGGLLEMGHDETWRVKRKDVERSIWWTVVICNRWKKSLLSVSPRQKCTSRSNRTSMVLRWRSSRPGCWTPHRQTDGVSVIWAAFKSFIIRSDDARSIAVSSFILRSNWRTMLKEEQKQEE